MKIHNRDHAREEFARAGITTDNVSLQIIAPLWAAINKRMVDSGCFRGTFCLIKLGKDTKDIKYLRCKAFYFDDREAVSFNSDGFIGFAGWASNTNIRPILDGVGDFLDRKVKNHDRHPLPRKQAE